MDYIRDLHELCDLLGKQVAESTKRLQNTGGRIDNADADYIDKLTHAMKSVKCVISMMDDEDAYSERGSYDDGMNTSNRASYRRSYADGSYDDGRGSYARGRGRYAKRDSMGRYSRERGYSRADDAADALREAMENAPDDQMRQEIQRLVDKMEQR